VLKNIRGGKSIATGNFPLVSDGAQGFISQINKSALGLRGFDVGAHSEGNK